MLSSYNFKTVFSAVCHLLIVSQSVTCIGNLFKKLINIKQPREDLSNVNRSINKNVKKEKNAFIQTNSDNLSYFNKYGNKILVI
jgi:hypothetical protein